MRPSAKRRPQASVPGRQHKALELLWEAYAEALAHQLEPWEFAVSFESLRLSGLAESDLRAWLCERLVEHRQESFPEEGRGRCFHPIATLAIPENTCVVLTEAGIQHVQALGLAGRPAGSFRTARTLGNGNAALVRLKPHYDSETRQLWLGDHLVKQLKQTAEHQHVVLLAFEEDGWPEWIDDPLTQKPGQDPQQHLHEVVGNLNRYQNLPGVHFRCGGNGTRVRWEIRPAGPR
jgi:hypothetical protein